MGTDPSKYAAQFVADLAHKSITPLNAILGFAALMRDDEGSPLGAEHEEFVDDILESAELLLGVFNDALDLVCSSFGSLDLDVVPVELARAAHAAALRRTPLASELGVAIDVVVSPAETPHALADLARVRDILSAFLTQALRHSNPGDRITVSLGASPGAVSVAVESPQIADDEERAELLRRIDTRRPGGGPDFGTGLELPLASLFAEGMGGWVSVESADEGRVRYRLSLPTLADDQTIDLVTPREDGYVLIYEPCARSRRLLAGALDVAGVESVVAATSFDALIACRTEAPLALVLHDGDGAADLLRALRRNAALDLMPAIAWTQTDVLALPPDLVPEARASKLDGPSALLAELQPFLNVPT